MPIWGATDDMNPNTAQNHTIVRDAVVPLM
jgi:hypothetical protein